MAEEYDITIEQGATFELPIVWKDEKGTPIDLTGYKARMQIRKRIRSDEILASLTTENGRIVLGGAAGTIDIVIPATETEKFSFSRGVYDLELEGPGGYVVRLIQGSVCVSPEVTRDD